MEIKNPFEYNTPDGISAQDIIELFVPVFGEYYNIPSIGHTFINGSRGSGKSMMFRFMAPDCQVYDLETRKVSRKINQLDYFAIHIPIKEGLLDKTDLGIIENKHGEALLNEHFMIVSFALKIFSKLNETKFEDEKSALNYFTSFLKESFVDRLWYCGWETKININEDFKSFHDVLRVIIHELDNINREFTVKYLRKLINAGSINAIPYDGAIFTFWDFLFPMLQKLRTYNIFPNKPIYLLIDDADNLSVIQTKILNTWVSLRTTNDVCFKISTQLRYKTYRTINNSRIDTPHDYSEVNIFDTYTSNKGQYKDRIIDAVKRRLNKYGYGNIDVKDFFPVDVQQEKKIAYIFQQYKSEKGYDFAYRYARPDFIKELGGNRNTYSYAGFDQLVNISSGTMREFIEFAKRMFNKQLSENVQPKEVKFISASIQDSEIKKYSTWFMLENFDKLVEDQQNDNTEIEKFTKLRNLIEALGQTFKLILLSEMTERRVFSFAIQDEPDDELRDILKLGVINGYFQSSSIGNKMGTGRKKLYIFNRLLAPHFGLDPSSFAGYKFVTSDILKEALFRPNTFVGKIKNKGADAILINPQQSLFKD